MRWVERGALAAGLMLAGCAIADTPTYGKVETFQPGKKYNCVPTADHKGWDCSESGKAENAPAQTDTPSAPPAAQAMPQPVAPTAPPPAAEMPPKTSALPGYLMNSSAGNRPVTATQTPPPAPKAEPVPEPIAAEPVEPKPATEAPPAPPAPIPAPVPAPTTPEHAPQPAAPGPAPSSSAFLALSPDHYVVELAHSDSASALTEPAVPGGKVYKLHLRQNGNESWLLLWGPFDSIESARRARDQAVAQDLTPGWPRPIGPLQAELRRASQ